MFNAQVEHELKKVWKCPENCHNCFHHKSDTKGPIDSFYNSEH